MNPTLGGARAAVGVLSSALLLTSLSSAAVAQTTTTVTRVVSYDYDAWGQLKKETTQPDDPALRVVTEYARAQVGGADFGLVSAKTLTWVDPASGTTQSRVVQSLTYGAQGRFALTQTNAKQQTVTSSFDAVSGAVLSVQQP